MKIRFLYLIFLPLFFSSCSVVIPEHNLVKRNNMDKKSTLFEIKQYNNKVLQKTGILSNIAFKFRGRTMNALGITKIDEENASYKVAALNPMGITLFQLVVKNNKIISSYVIEQFAPRQKGKSEAAKAIGNNKNNLDKAAKMISQDIANIYFARKINIQENFPGTNKERDRVTFDIKLENNEYLKYTFTGKPFKLTTKTKYAGKEKLWSADYYDYHKIKEKEMPFKIIFQNHKYGYMLKIETKTIKNY